MLDVDPFRFGWPKQLSKFLYWMATEQEDRPWQSTAHGSRDYLETGRGVKRESVTEDAKTQDLQGPREGFLSRLQGFCTQVTSTDVYGKDEEARGIKRGLLSTVKIH